MKHAWSTHAPLLPLAGWFRGARRALLPAAGLCCLFSGFSSLTAAASTDQVPPAEALFKTLDQSFYRHYASADGLLVAGSEKVSRHALDEAAYLVRMVLAKRPDVMRSLVEKRKMVVSVMAYTEMQRDLPDCRRLSPWWDYRARGLSGGRWVSCGEENLLCFPGDAWQGENILIHEFAHGIQGTIARLDERYDERFRALFDKARKSGRVRGYAISNPGEFWAEGVQAWFNCNATIRPRSGGRQSSFEVLGPNGEHVCHITRREELKKHFPEYAELLDETFGRNEWVYVPPAQRLDQPHLRGYDPGKAPTFRWPPEVVEAFEKAEAQKAKRRAETEEAEEQAKNVPE